MLATIPTLIHERVHGWSSSFSLGNAVWRTDKLELELQLILESAVHLKVSPHNEDGREEGVTVGSGLTPQTRSGQGGDSAAFAKGDHPFGQRNPDSPSLGHPRQRERVPAGGHEKTSTGAPLQGSLGI